LSCAALSYRKVEEVDKIAKYLDRWIDIKVVIKVRIDHQFKITGSQFRRTGG
jgi:hypothetical protein